MGTLPIKTAVFCSGVVDAEGLPEPRGRFWVDLVQEPKGHDLIRKGFKFHQYLNSTQRGRDVFDQYKVTRFFFVRLSSGRAGFWFQLADGDPPVLRARPVLERTPGGEGLTAEPQCRDVGMTPLHRCRVQVAAASRTRERDWLDLGSASLFLCLVAL